MCWRHDGFLEKRIFVVEHRDRVTLIPIIEKEILSGITIMSDEWKPYKVLQNKVYNHLTINHFENIVGPPNRSQHPDNRMIWSHLKMIILKKMHDTTSKLLQCHLIEALKHGRNQLILKILF